ncbi:MAG: FHA domain-containing protein [Lacisediminihabitans sp.]
MSSNSSPESGETEDVVGSTDAEFGAGRPRLIFKVGSDLGADAKPREFDLLNSTTKIGSGADMHLKLDGLAPSHAEIRHEEDDEYVLYIHDPADSASEPASPTGEDPEAVGRVLRTGARVDLGDWSMSFYREEFADHGRPFGGREGGEGETQLDQNGEVTGE